MMGSPSCGGKGEETSADVIEVSNQLTSSSSERAGALGGPDLIRRSIKRNFPVVLEAHCHVTEQAR